VVKRLEFSQIALPQRLDHEQVPEAVRVLGQAFHAYPTMRYVLDGDAAGYAQRLDALLRFFVRVRLLRGEPVIGLDDGNAIVAVALLSDPSGPASPPEVGAIREELWADLGPAAQQRYETFGAATDGLFTGITRLHLNMIGVRPALRGYGYSTHLLDEVHRIARTTPGVTGVSLTTEDPANLPLYARLGYEVVAEAVVAGDVKSWGMFRGN
jgi:GNAT superfamily N-acetyltransferase